jgi:multicomponent Na+:H+ antiporter subunit E
MQKSINSHSRLRSTGIMFFTLLLFWLMLVNTLAADTLLVGIVVSLAIALLYPNGLSFFTEFRATPQAVIAGFHYFGHFFRQLVRSNFRLARIVLSPDLPVDPGIVKIRTRLSSRMGRLMLANSITLTPGTLTVDVDGEWLYVHCVTTGATDVEGATREIAADLERYLEVMYG